MLNDMIQLHIPDCRLFNSSLTCTIGGALSPSTYNADPAATVYSFCQWSDVDGKSVNICICIKYYIGIHNLPRRMFFIMCPTKTEKQKKQMEENIIKQQNV